MAHYPNLSECIKMCDRILRNSSYPRNDMMNPEISHPPMFQPSDTTSPNLMYLKAGNAFHPSRTIVVQNFLPDAGVHVRSFVAMFGLVEICEVIKDGAPSAVAVVQYKSKTSAADAILAIPDCQIRCSNLAVNLLWNGPYEHIDYMMSSVNRSHAPCAEKRVVCMGNLPRNITKEAIYKKCGIYGFVEDMKVHPQSQGAFVYVVFTSALSAAVATYCLRNNSTTSAALVLGFGDNGSPVLLGPAKMKPLDQYSVPLSEFDVRCVCTRFLDYSRMKGLFVNVNRHPPAAHFFEPGPPEYCFRLHAPHLKGVSLYLEVVLRDEGLMKEGGILNEMVYQLCPHKYLYRLIFDFNLHKPIMNTNERNFRSSPQFVRWNSLSILDLQLSVPWGYSDPNIVLRMQGMNHIYSDIDSTVFEETKVSSNSTWFGSVQRHAVVPMFSDTSTQHQNRMQHLMSENLPILRLSGKYNDLNQYLIPIHAHSELQF